jgi:hypothetical protein
VPPDRQPPTEPGADRSTKALGRGLEEVSHLFLSGTREGGAHARSHDLPPKPAATRPAARAGVAVLRPGAAISKDQLTTTLVECEDALEQGMRALGTAVSCSPYGEIDLLAVDRLNRLTIIDIDTTLGDGLLLRGFSHVDWVLRNVSNVRRMFENWTIDSSQPPRLLLVAPTFSPLSRAAARQFTGPTVACFKYHAVSSFGGPGIFIEPLHDDA